MSLVEDARPAARRLVEAATGATVRIVAHASGDGVAAAAILAKALSRAGCAFHVRFSRFDEADGDSEADPGDVHLFLGLGAPRALDGPRLAGATFLVDARPGAWPRETKGLVGFNPVLLGEPVHAASASTAALALAMALDGKNADLAKLALVGAVARRRARPSFAGWLQTVHAEAIRTEAVAEAPRPNLADEPLLETVAFAPAALHGIGGGYAASESFLGDHRLPAEATVHELDEATRQRFGSAIALAALRAGRPAAELARLVAPQPMDAQTPLARIASWLDAAARDGEGGLALGYALGDSESRAELEALEGRVRRRRREALRAFDKERRIDPHGFIRASVAQAADTGPVAELLSEHWRFQDRIVSAHAAIGHDMRVSLRLAAGAADLGAVVSKAASAVEGSGGGGPEAAGARLPAARLGEFYEGIAREIGGAT